MEGEQTEYVWGVVDFTPDTDFPDMRSKCIIHSNNGTCMVIPREGDTVRLYIQLESKDATNAATIKSQMGPHQLLEVCARLFLLLQESKPILLGQVARKSFQPYTIQTPETIDWWTVYISTSEQSSDSFLVKAMVIISWTKGCFEILSRRARLHRWRCMSYSLP